MGLGINPGKERWLDSAEHRSSLAMLLVKRMHADKSSRQSQRGKLEDGRDR